MFPNRPAHLPAPLVLAGVVLGCTALANGPDAEAPLKPVSVCEVLAHPEQYSGKPVLLLGRFSFRESGRYLSQDKCPSAEGGLGVLSVVVDRQGGPLPPENMSVDTHAVDRELGVMQKSTMLVSFRFGSTDYDRWSVVYGRFEPVPKAEKKGPAEFSAVLGRVVCRGESLVIFLRDH